MEVIHIIKIITNKRLKEELKKQKLLESQVINDFGLGYSSGIIATLEWLLGGRAL